MPVIRRPAKLRRQMTLSVTTEVLQLQCRSCHKINTSSRSATDGARRYRKKPRPYVGLVQRGYSIPSPVLLKCCVASVVAQCIVLYRTCTGQPAVWGFVSLGPTHCDRVFLFRGSLVTRLETPGGFGASSGLWLANFSFSTLMLLVGSFDL